VSVIASDDAVERQLTNFDGNVTTLRRASVLTITALCTDKEIRSAMRELVSWASDPAQLVEEQWAWYQALGRPYSVEAKVVEGLQAALVHRGLDWTLRRFGTAEDAWAAYMRDVPWGGGVGDVDEVWPDPTINKEYRNVPDSWPDPIEDACLPLDAWGRSRKGATPGRSMSLLTSGMRSPITSPYQSVGF
jgi:hypothetical protein